MQRPGHTGRKALAKKNGPRRLGKNLNDQRILKQCCCRFREMGSKTTLKAWYVKRLPTVSVFAFNMVILADAANQTNRYSVSTGLTVSAWCRSIQIERNQKSLVCKNMNLGSFVRVSSFAGSMLPTIHSLRTWTRCSRMRPLFLLIARAAGSASKVRKRSLRYKNRGQET